MTVVEGHPRCPLCKVVMRMTDAGEHCSLWVCSCGESFVYRRAALRNGMKLSANPI